MTKLFSPFFAIFLMLSCKFSFAQFAIVQDKDSLLNVREEGQANGKVVDQLPNGQLLYCMDNKGNWTNIQYSKKGKERSGYVYHNRYKLVSSFPALTAATPTATSITLKKDSIRVIITQRKFDQRKHQIQYRKDYPAIIEQIDHQQYWGRDGDMPTNQFESIVIKRGQQQITLPKTALAGLYEPSIASAAVYYDPATDTFYIHTMNSDGAGAYEVVWSVEKGIYKDRLVAYGF